MSDYNCGISGGLAELIAYRSSVFRKVRRSRPLIGNGPRKDRGIIGRIGANRPWIFSKAGLSGVGFQDAFRPLCSCRCASSASCAPAARKLGMSASGVSRAISRLEEKLGARLFDCSTGLLRLTDKGARLYRLAAPHLSGLETAARTTSNLAADV
ncbi:LysR family transcriptional regulator [Hartmannibacter diazotrophicus]|uniref:LysR family transcriptional regulator n=1 Tax=Hartmannibacter diazotrophicus TaxID=1482074 RepID=UPI003CCBC356